MSSHFDVATKEGLDTIKKLNNTLNPYAKLQAGESKEWYFDPNSIEKVPNKFNANQERFRFKIYDPEVDAEFLWDVSMGAAKRVVAAMEKGNYFLKISRSGEGMETRYTVEPINTEPAELKTSDESGGELE